MGKAGRRTWLAVLLTVVAGGLAYGGWKWWELKRYQRAMAEIQREIDNGRFALASKQLGSLLATKPGSAEPLYLLGLCEKERGQTEQAFLTWARVPPDSPFGRQAIQGRIELQIQGGRLADAEELVRDMLGDPRIEDADLSILLGPVYSQEGRLDEAERSIKARWNRMNRQGEGASEKARNLVRLYSQLEENTPPVDAIRAFLDYAASQAPKDDRVWLGRANLAIRTGAFDQAAPLLEECLLRRPDDPPVWRARLKWAMATGRVAVAREALQHLPAGEESPAEVQRLIAWFARQRGDLAKERRALVRLRVEAPADITALDRLIELAAAGGQTDKVAELRREKAIIKERQARFRKLWQRNQPSRDSAELARLSEQLGRWFEARVYATITAAPGSRRGDLRAVVAALKRHAEAIDDSGRTLAAVVAPELDDGDKPAPSPAAH